MRRTPEQLEAEVVAEAKALIAELMAWERQAGARKLSQLEEKVLAHRQRFAQRVLEALIEDQEARQPLSRRSCRACGAEMPYKGQKGTAIETRLAEIGQVTLPATSIWRRVQQAGSQFAAFRKPNGRKPPQYWKSGTRPAEKLD